MSQRGQIASDSALQDKLAGAARASGSAPKAEHNRGTLPSYRTIISALSVGQILVWAVMYYGFSSFVLPMQRDMGWSQPDIMGAFTLGLMVWGLATYAVGAAQAQAVAVMVWFGPAQVAGCFAFLWLGRPLSHRALGLMALGLFPLALAVFALGRQPLVLVGFAVLFGVANGLITIVRSNIVPDFYGREQVGRISGAMSGIALCTRAAAPLVTAWALLGLGGYAGLLWLLVGLGAVALALFALAKPPLPQH